MTSSTGSKSGPSLSPDGNWIAFAWEGERRDNWDIYVKDLTSPGEPTRLTFDPAEDNCPAWSPDGRQIIFARCCSGDQGAIYQISPLGGSERKLADRAGGPLSWSPDRRSIAFQAWGRISWSPDGRNIAFQQTGPILSWSVWSLSRDTRERKRLANPVPGGFGDCFARFSPDGRYLAFLRNMGVVRQRICVISLPEGRIKGLKDAVGAFYHLKTPLEFDAPDNQPVSLCFILLVPKDANEQHLQILGELAQLFGDDAMRTKLLNAATPCELIALLSAWTS